MEKLKEFLYLLMRDEVVPGAVEQLVRQAENTGTEHVVYTNKGLAQYAEELAKRLTTLGGKDG